MEIHDDAITGKDGYLFLHSGANDNFSYVSFEKIFSEEELSQLVSEWRDASRHAQHSGANYQVLIFPNKETICWDKHPLSETLSSPQSVGRYLKDNDKDGLIQFWPEGDSSFFMKFDTHFSHVGNLDHSYKICRMIDDDFFGAMSKDQFWDKLNHRCYDFVGDLGNRFDPPRSEPRWVVGPAKSFSVVSNGVNNRGFIELTTNENAPVKKRVLVFGDSYYRGMRFFISPWFSEVVFVHTTRYCPDLVELFRPDFVLQSYVERFLAMPPKPLFASVPFEKIALQTKQTVSRDMRAVIAALPR